MSNSFPSFSINDGDWVRVRQFIQRVSTHDLQGGGSLIPYIGAVSNVNLGAHTLTTTGTAAMGNLTVSSTLLLASGSITDSTGAISFSNENLSTTGTLASGTHTIGTLVLAAGSITDTGGKISFGDDNIYTTGTISLGYNNSTQYPIFIRGTDAATYTVYIKSEDSISRVLIESETGAQVWQLNTTAAEAGRIAFATPNSYPAIFMEYYNSGVADPLTYRNRFVLRHDDTTFRMGFWDDVYAMLAFHKGSKLQVNWGNRNFDFQVSGDVDTNLFYCDAGNDRVGISTATPDVTFDVAGVSRFGASATNYAQFAADGELTLVGTAKVKKRIPIPLAAVKTGAINPPGEGNIDGFRTLDFDGGIKDEEVFKPFCGPLDWSAGTGATLDLRFFVDTAPAAPANVVWQIEIKSIACEGIVDFSSGTSTYIDIVAITTGTPANDKKVHCSELTIPAGDLIEGGCLFIRLHRDATHASDTFTGDARLLKAFITYTADKLGQAT